MRTNRDGVTLPEVVVVLLLVTVVFFLALMALPRAREQARFAGCQRNLAQIGLALVYYDQSERQLPVVSGLADPFDDAEEAGAESRDPSPLQQVLATFGLPDLRGLNPVSPPKPGGGSAPAEVAVPGFVCSSDPNATAGQFPAPVSYRATTGDDPTGKAGAFAPGRTIGLAAVEAADGLAFTAGYSERLVGDGRVAQPGLMNYARCGQPLNPDTTQCPASSTDADWRGDAGRSWLLSDYRSTLYNHVLLPNGGPSCLGEHGQTAIMGASSGHVRGVNLLFLDGSVRPTQPSVDLKIWREFAAIGEPDAREDSQVEENPKSGPGEANPNPPSNPGPVRN
jgi:prepilin-type processing-associated H-X9-DG protein